MKLHKNHRQIVELTRKLVTLSSKAHAAKLVLHREDYRQAGTLRTKAIGYYHALGNMITKTVQERQRIIAS